MEVLRDSIEQNFSDYGISIFIITVQSRLETNRDKSYLRTDCQISVHQRRTVNREKQNFKGIKRTKTDDPFSPPANQSFWKVASIAVKDKANVLWYLSNLGQGLCSKVAVFTVVPLQLGRRLFGSPYYCYSKREIGAGLAL